MPLKKTEQAILETLGDYWRQRAALAFLKQIPGKEQWHHERLEYRGLPGVGLASAYLGPETISIALERLSDHEREQMPLDTFLLILSKVETFLSAKLSAKGLDPEGTLGELQKRAQNAYSISGAAVLRFDELRERRNSFIHHGGIATQRYINAATQATPHSSGHVGVPAGGILLSISETYLSYAADAAIVYARLYP